MAGTLGLTAYRALMRRGEATLPKRDVPRPSGELLWVHCGTPDDFIAVQDLALRQMSSREGLCVLITFAEEPRSSLRDLAAEYRGVILDVLPSEHPDSVTAFLDHWQPDCCLWTWGGLRPNLVIATSDRDVPLLLVNADAHGFDRQRDRWLPDVTRALLPRFAAVMARTPEAARRLTQLGLNRDDIALTAPLSAGSQALPCNETDITELAAACVGRPIWFANGVQQDELQTVLAAHRQALRLSHRLLLILRPAGRTAIALAHEQARAREFRTLSWDDGQFPDETTQVLITEDLADVGLFYRMAPVSFLGGSLVAGELGCDPLEAAALGSAVLYGPRVGQYLQSYSRLANAGAARIINDSSALGTAVTRLVAPDQAALMAHAGWEVISEGAALSDRITDLVQDTLDTQAGMG
ncbi:glycosyltransferase N-terminal domain-containing protein [Sulfitobacter sp. HNIBRBA3233]|uniref:3-deoxy-D-manno-octulosonic acid transferase n=1 Tax=Sulfitobacter marinivivus TaxID=3158558 RepID=UPI0032DE696B